MIIDQSVYGESATREECEKAKSTFEFPGYRCVDVQYDSIFRTWFICVMKVGRHDYMMCCTPKAWSLEYQYWNVL